MKLNILILILLSLLIQSCSMLPGTYNAGGYSASNYGNSYRGPINVELVKVKGNDLKFVVERLVFIKTLKKELEQRGKVFLDDSPMLKLRINIERNIMNSRKYKTIQNGLIVYHLDEQFQTVSTYTITDKAGFVAAKGTIRYNATVRAKSGLDYDDAKRVALKRLFEALAKRVAADISAKGTMLSSKYN